MLGEFRIYSPTEVFFGAGSVNRLASLLKSRTEDILLVRGSSNRSSASLMKQLLARGYSVDEVSIIAEPSIGTINSNLETCVDRRYGAVVACGGGAVIDAAKAIRFGLEAKGLFPTDLTNWSSAHTDQISTLPLIAIPTTAGTGSEVTGNAVLDDGTRKISLRGRAVFPTFALVDPLLMSTAPKSVALGAGLDAVVQNIEAYTSAVSTPFTDSLARANVHTSVQVLKELIEINDHASWTRMAWFATSSGIALSNGGLGAAHGLASVLGARLGAPHGLVCGRLIGAVLLANRSKAELGSEGYRRIEKCIEHITDVFPPVRADTELSGFFAWLKKQSVPRLRDWGAVEGDFSSYAELAVFASSSTKNAIRLKKSDFVEILEATF